MSPPFAHGYAIISVLCRHPIVLESAMLSIGFDWHCRSYVKDVKFFCRVNSTSIREELDTPYSVQVQCYPPPVGAFQNVHVPHLREMRACKGGAAELQTSEAAERKGLPAARLAVTRLAVFLACRGMHIGQRVSCGQETVRAHQTIMVLSACLPLFKVRALPCRNVFLPSSVHLLIKPYET